MSKASVDLPEPDTPVTTLNLPRGISTSMRLQVVLARVDDADDSRCRERAAHA
jgi:hypothetical protein